MPGPRRNVVLIGDAGQQLGKLPSASIDCVITSPPYFQLRDYDAHGQIGLEPTVERWVDKLAAVMTEVGRVLADHGTVWLNLGDSYSRHGRYGGLPKSLLLGPERLLLALSARGWIVRNKIAWAKTNPRPASVGDRLTCTWEPLYLLARQRRYFFDLDAIRVPHRSMPGRQRRGQPAPASGRPTWAGPLANDHSGLPQLKAAGRVGHPLGKNPGDVWSLPASGYRGAHFATFPDTLVERPLLASCPERVCAACGEPWWRRRARMVGGLAVRGRLAPGCVCRAAYRPGMVLDPFMGAGTVAVVAEKHGRDWLGVEINPSFARLAQERLAVERIRRAAA